MKLPLEIRRDPYLAPLIKKYGLPQLAAADKPSSAFKALLREIIYQQLSGKAAGTIYGRFEQLFPRKHPTPERVLAITHEQLRGAGLSNAKATYVKHLAQKFADRSIPHRSFSKLPSEEIAKHLITVKGIGEWTVHMFLLFTLQRPDVLPTGDLGIRKGFQRLYKLKQLPAPHEMEKLAKPWRTHASVAAWYLWRLADDKDTS